MSSFDKEGEKQARKVLLEQAKELELEVDGRWSVETLAEKVAEALDGLEERENARVAQESDTWVFAIRDCFLGTVKQPAGSVFKAPKDLYRVWAKVGASRLADEDEVSEAQGDDG